MATTPTVIGRFKIIRKIGQGGMGALYVGFDPMLEREIAIKVLLDDNDELRERFTREARSVARLRHPHIVTIFDVGEHEGQPFIAMEFIQGRTLAEIIRSTMPLTVVQKLLLMEELCDGLAFAHKSGVVHRDIKPANVMVDQRGSLKILDFGIARVGPGMTRAGMLIGTLNYMSPEQVMGQNIDGRSDMFAVGEVLYELFAYQRAFPGGLEDGILHKILHLEPAPLETICQDLDPEIIEVVNRAIQKEPERRYQDLSAMGDDLRRVRQRLETSQPTVTELDRGLATIATGPGSPAPDAPPTPSTPRGRDREALARRRSAQIDAHLNTAAKAMAAKDYERTIIECEEVLLLDSENPRAFELLDRARTAAEERRASDWLNDAQQHFDQGEITSAFALVEKALLLTPASGRGDSLLRALEQAREEQRAQRERAENCRRALARAQECLDRGSYAGAAAAVDEALSIDADADGAALLKQRALDGLEVLRQTAEDQRARATIAEAQRVGLTGDDEAALKLLAAFTPARSDVADALTRLRSDMQTRRREEERRLEEERRAEEEQHEQERLVRAALERARASLAIHDFAGAIGILRQLRKSAPNAPGLQDLMGEAENQQAEAERLRLAAVEIRNHLEAASGRLAAGDLDAARTGVTHALALDPEHAEALGLLGRIDDAIRSATGREQDARRERERALADAMERASGAASHDAAIDALREALAVDPGHQPAERSLKMHEAALERERQEDLAHEQAEARRRRERDEAVAAAIRNATKADSHASALALLKTALELNPNHPEARRLFDVHDAALKKEAAAERRRREIEAGCLEIESLLASGAFDAAERTIASFEQAGDAKKAMKPLRARLQRERAAASKRREPAASHANAPADPHATRGAAATVVPPVPNDETVLIARDGAADGVSLSLEGFAPAHGASGTGDPQARSKAAFLYIGGAVALVVLSFAGYRVFSRPGTSAPAPTSGQPTTVPAPAGERAPADAAPVNPSNVGAAPPVVPAAPTGEELTAPGAGPAADVERRLKPLRLLARQQATLGAREQALATVKSGLDLSPKDEALQAILNTLVIGARAAMQRAREIAVGRGAAAVGSADFKEGVARQDQAARFTRNRQLEPSLRALWEATDLFTKAAGAQATRTEPTAAPSPTAGPVAPLPTSPQSAAAPPTDPPPNDRAATPTPQPPSNPIPPPQQAQAPPQQAPPRAPNEEPAIRIALQAFEQAYSSRDPAAVKRVYPAIDANTLNALAKGFRQIRSLSFQIVNEQIVPSGATATVRAQVRQHSVMEAGRAQDIVSDATFRLEKTAGGWVIVQFILQNR